MDGRLRADVAQVESSDQATLRTVLVQEPGRGEKVSHQDIWGETIQVEGEQS